MIAQALFAKNITQFVIAHWHEQQLGAVNKSVADVNVTHADTVQMLGTATSAAPREQR